MKKMLILFILCLFAVMSAPAAAQPGKPATPAIIGSDPHAGHGAPSSTPSPDVAKPQATDPDADKHIQMIQGHTQKMRDQMEKIKAAKDPKERQKLMQEHKTSMREGMKMMKDMPGCQMMAGGMKSGEPGKMEMKPMGMAPMMACHRMMEKKMEMMQLMVEGLIESSQMKP